MSELQLRLDKMSLGMSAEVPISLKVPEGGSEIKEDDFLSSYGKQNFMADIRRIKDYILDGDVMQVVLSQRMSVPLKVIL